MSQDRKTVVEQIEAALDQKDIRRAGHLLKQHRPQAQDDDKYQYLTAYHAYLHQNYNLCIQILEDFADADKEAKYVVLLADAYFERFENAPIGHTRRDDAEQSLQYYHIVANQYADYSNIGWVHYRMGLVFKKIDQRESAYMCFRKALSLPSKVPTIKSQCYEQLAYHDFYDRRDFKQALALIDLAIAVYPSGHPVEWLVQPFLFRARVLQTLKQFSKASDALQHLVKLARNELSRNPTIFADVLLSTGELLTQIEGFESVGLDYLNEYLTLRPRPEGVDVSWSRASEIIADVLFAQGRFQEALGAYKDVVKHNPYHPWITTIYYHMARCYYDQADYPAAIATIQTLFDIAERDNMEVRDFRVYDMLGSSQFAIGNYREAAQSYHTALSIAPDQPNVTDKIRLYWHYSVQLAYKREVE